MKNYSIIFISIIVFLISCDETLEYENVNIPVVEGYLYEGESIDSIKISNIINYGSESALDFQEITNIQIEVDGIVYPLSEVKRDSNITFAADSNLIVEEGKVYDLSFNYGDENVKSSTIGISKPTGFYMSESNLYIERMDGTSMPDMSELETIEVVWDNFYDEYFYLVIQYLEETADPVRSDFDMEPEDVIEQPMVSNAYNMNARRMMFFGRYQIILFKVTQDYANMYERIENTSQSLTEPYSNIENGKGIFTSIASDTLFFTVRESK
jgi:hypothetical protein